jgi:hypothetical protein
VFPPAVKPRVNCASCEKSEVKGKLFSQMYAARRVKSIQGVTAVRNLSIRYRHPRSLLGCSPRTVVDRCWGSVCVPREVRYWE